MVCGKKEIAMEVVQRLSTPLISSFSFKEGMVEDEGVLTACTFRLMVDVDTPTMVVNA